MELPLLKCFIIKIPYNSFSVLWAMFLCVTLSLPTVCAVAADCSWHPTTLRNWSQQLLTVLSVPHCRYDWQCSALHLWTKTISVRHLGVAVSETDTRWFTTLTVGLSATALRGGKNFSAGGLSPAFFMILILPVFLNKKLWCRGYSTRPG